jgi:hypothetical protein
MSSAPFTLAERERLLARLREIAPDLVWQDDGRRSFAVRVADTTIRAAEHRISATGPAISGEWQVIAGKPAYVARLLRVVGIAQGNAAADKPHRPPKRVPTRIRTAAPGLAWKMSKTGAPVALVGDLRVVVRDKTVCVYDAATSRRLAIVPTGGDLTTAINAAIARVKEKSS